MPSPRFSPAFLKPQIHVAGFTIQKVVAWVPTLAVWGAGAGAGLSLYLSQIPLFQQDVLRKIPGIAGYFTDKTPDSDKPF